jgi:hypothetical protein
MAVMKFARILINFFLIFTIGYLVFMILQTKRSYKESVEKISSLNESTSEYLHSMEMLKGNVLKQELLFLHENKLGLKVPSRSDSTYYLFPSQCLLFFVFKEGDCEACIQEAEDFIRSLSLEDQLKINVIFFTSNERSAFIVSQRFSKFAKFYFMSPFDELPQVVNREIGKPVWLVINQNRVILSYIPEISLQDFNRSAIKLLLEKKQFKVGLELSKSF